MNRKFPPLSQAPAAAAVFTWMHGAYAVRSLRVARGLTQACSAAGTRGLKKALAGTLRHVCSRTAGLCLRASVALFLHTCFTLSLSYTHTRARKDHLPANLNPCGASRGVPPRAPSYSGQTHFPQPSPRLVFLPLSRRPDSGFLIKLSH